jgi:hypothetical protein
MTGLLNVYIDEAAFPPIAVAAVGAGCVGSTVFNEAQNPH